MKKHIGQLCLVAILGAMGANAQASGPGGFDDRPSGGGAQTTADAIARRVQFLTALLTLTTAQATQATTIFTNEAAVAASLQTSLDTARTSLKAAVQSNNTAQIDQLATQIGTLSGQLLAAESKADAAFYALLTTDQRTRYDAVGNRGPGGPGGPGGHGR